MEIEEKIADYLHTQGLRLPENTVKEATLIFNALFLHVQTDSVQQALHTLWVNKEQDLPLSFAGLCRIYALADILFSQYPCHHLSLWHLAKQAPQLNCLFALGAEQEALLPVSESACVQHLAVRTVFTAWLNHVEDVGQWLAEGLLIGARHRDCQTQWALPICHQSGAVWGVLYGENTTLHLFDEAMQCGWVGLAIALEHLVDSQALLPQDAHFI